MTLVAAIAGSTPMVAAAADATGAANLALAARLRVSPWTEETAGTEGRDATAQARAAAAAKAGVPTPRRVLATATGDLDGDGLDDLVVSYELAPGSGAGGALAVFPTNPDAVHPNSPEARRRRDEGGSTAPLLDPAIVMLDERADLIGLGDVDGDGWCDVVVAHTGARVLRVLEGDADPAATLRTVRRVPLPGTVTALAVAQLGERDAIDDVAAALTTAAGPRLWLARGSRDAGRFPPTLVELPAVATTVRPTRVRPGHWGDLAVAAGTHLLLLATNPERGPIGPDEGSSGIVPRRVAEAVLESRVRDLATVPRPGVAARDLLVADTEGRLVRLPVDAGGFGAPSSERGADPTLDQVVAARLPRAGGSPYVLASGGRVTLARARAEAALVEHEVTAPAAAARIVAMRLNHDAIDDLVVLEDGRWTPSVELTGSVSFTVTDVGDEPDDCSGDGVCAIGGAVPGACNEPPGPCTWRAAFDEASHLGVPATIGFAVPSPLPVQIETSLAFGLSTPFTVDGTTQPGYSGTPVVTLRRSDGAQPISVNVGTSTVRGLAILGTGANASTGLLVTCNDNVIEGNFIGLGPGGSPAPFTTGLALQDFSCAACSCLIDGNLIGGASVGAGNVIAGNSSTGVALNSGFSAGTVTDTTVAGNRIGTNPLGTAALPNGTAGSGAGLSVTGGAVATTVGGTTAGAGNLISGNQGAGVSVATQTTPVELLGNRIGTDAGGAVALGNAGRGISVSFDDEVVVGGSAAGAGNVIAANGGPGLYLQGDDSDSLIRGNRIGVGASGDGDLGNGGDGVYFATRRNTGLVIGGLGTGDGNRIAWSAGAGIATVDDFHTAHTAEISGNSISHNDGLAIDLRNDGVTDNDPDDLDGGPNGLQNFPLLTSATTGGGQLEVVGSLDSTPSASFRIEVFASPACDPSGHGEAEVFLGSFQVATDAEGDAGFSDSVPDAGLEPGWAVTATATRAGDTSEVGPCIGFDGAAPGQIFADGFESGTLSAWSAIAP